MMNPRTVQSTFERHQRQARWVLWLTVIWYLCLMTAVASVGYLLTVLDWSHGLRGVLQTIWTGVR